LLFNKNVVVEPVLIMEWILNRLVFILRGNANNNGKMVGASASKMVKIRCNEDIRRRFY
jgi:hypothetical protein